MPTTAVKNKHTEREKTRKTFKIRTFYKVLIVLAVIYIILAAISFPLTTVRYTVFSDELSSPMRLVQISDLHSYAYGKDMQTLINAVDEASPDIIVFTGDIYDDISDSNNTRTLLKNLGGRYKCFYVAGNHEFRTPLWGEYKAEAESFGITVMEGDTVQLDGITLCGAAKDVSNSISWDESVALCAEKADGFTVLLDHFPAQIDYYRSFGKFDLILSGHAHGGQWRIPFILNGLFSPDEYFFPKYAGGRYDFDDSVMIVSRGLKRDIIPVARIFNNPELVVIDICPSES